MARWLDEVAEGDSDGINDSFDVSEDYKPGTTAVRVNGLQLTPGEWAEVASSKTVILLEPPGPLHRVTVRFRTVT